VSAGFRYYSDEYAVIDEHGSLHPWARPLVTRGAGGQRESIPPRSLGRVGVGPASVGFVIATRFVEGQAAVLRSLDAGGLFLELMRNAVAARWRPGW
jgi:hypothetical protein